MEKELLYSQKNDPWPKDAVKVHEAELKRLRP